MRREGVGMSKIMIVDGPGKMPVDDMRMLFEQCIINTGALAQNTPLGIMEVNGKFHHYMDPDTDTMWLGFALGLRCAERLEKQRTGGSTDE